MSATAAEIEARLNADHDFAAAWASFPPSHRREWSRWVEQAKKPDTRTCRADQVVAQVRAKAG